MPECVCCALITTGIIYHLDGVGILSFSDIFLINNGPVANSRIHLPIPLIFDVHKVLNAESARGIDHFKIVAFGRLSGTLTLKVGKILQNLPSNHLRDPKENKVVNNDCCVRVRIAIFKRQSFMLRNNPFSSVACSDVICLIWAI